jgi:NAD-dependent DNA ligase
MVDRAEWLDARWLEKNPARKYDKARELGIPIVTEEEFLKRAHA